MAYEMVMPYHLHMPSYFLETFTEYPLEEDVLKPYVGSACSSSFSPFLYTSLTKWRVGLNLTLSKCFGRKL